MSRMDNIYIMKSGMCEIRTREKPNMRDAFPYLQLFKLWIMD